MRITTYRLGSQHRDLVARVEEIADQAAAIVARKVGRMGHVELAITDDSSAKDIIRSAQQELIGTRNKAGKGARGMAGMTTVSRAGILLVINADLHRRAGLREVDKTVVHELVHAVQLSPAAVRAGEIAALRHNYGLEALSSADLRQANRLVDTHEREARSLERLAHKLR